ncbi:adenylyl-sulfate kinase [Actinomycetota bacterium]|nr:adenylyl-sulfate kinase [Actinomycetota bacterium]
MKGSEDIKTSNGTVCWITGFSGAGKSTLASDVVSSLRHQGVAPIFLDGDDLRSLLGASTGEFSREERLRLAFVYSDLCRYLASQGVIVVIATMALFKEIHVWNRENLPNYFEIFLDIPMNVLKKRDPKGLYEKFSKGEVRNIAGLDFEVDLPSDADLVVGVEIKNREATVKEIVRKILEAQVE